MKFDDGNKGVRSLGLHPVAWFKEMWMTSDQNMVDYVGIDAALYVRFMTMCRDVFVALSVLGVCILIPINVVFNLRNPDSAKSTSADIFMLMTPTYLFGNKLYAHVVVMWLFNFVIMAFLWRTYNVVIKMRRDKFTTEEYQNELFMRSLMVTEIPKRYASDEGMIELMNRLKFNKPIQNTTVGRNVKDLMKLIKSHDKTVIALEKVLAKYLRNPASICNPRPRHKAFKQDQAVFGTEKIDFIDYLCWRITGLKKDIAAAQARIDEQKSLPYGFVSYETVEDCHMVALSTQQKRRGKVNSVLATRPTNIIWENIVLTRFERMSKERWGNILFGFLLIGWIVPNAFLGTFLSQLGRIGALWPPFNTFMDSFPFLFSIIQGILSPTVTSLIFLILPMIMRRLSHAEGKVTKHEREISVTKKLFVFFTFNNLFIFTLFSVVWSAIVSVVALVHAEDDLTYKQVLKQLEVGPQISNAILGASSFWVMYILRVNFGAVLDLLQLVSLVWRGFQRHFMSPTSRELAQWTAPQHFNFAAYYNWLLFYTTIALSFAVVQPLVLPAIAIYFTFDTVYKKYSLMYIFETKAESDGMYWPFLFNSFLFATGFGNLVLFAVVWAQGSWKVAVCLVPLWGLLIAFKVASARTHNDLFFYFIPTERERERMAAVRTRSNLSDESHTALTSRYRNPAITQEPMIPIIMYAAQPLVGQILDLYQLSDNTAAVARDGKQFGSFIESPRQNMRRCGVNGVRTTRVVHRISGLEFEIIDDPREHQRENCVVQIPLPAHLRTDVRASLAENPQPVALSQTLSASASIDSSYGHAARAC